MANENLAVLPEGPPQQPVSFPHFPTRHQAVVWRNWEVVPLERLAAALQTTPDNIVACATDMGLRVPPRISPAWLTHGYITIIRNNWHLLPYEQLLILLGWTADELAYTLKEDDFLFAKLSGSKPRVEPILYAPLNDDEARRTAQIKAQVERHFPELHGDDEVEPFDFLHILATPEIPSRRSFSPPANTEIWLDESWSIDYPAGLPHVAHFVHSFTSDHEARWGHRLSHGGRHHITLRVEPDDGLLAEGHSIEIDTDRITISAVDGPGLLRGLQWLEQKMLQRGGPFLSPGRIERRTRFDVRYIYPYCALYGDPLLNPELDILPDGLLSRLSKAGINGVWLQGILYTLYPWKLAPELSDGYQTRLETLRMLANRAADYGIGIYLYMNEPRGLSYEFWERHPELADMKGVSEDFRRITTMCSSHPGTHEFLRDATSFLFREVPELAGVFTITMVENPTTCFSIDAECPRCLQEPASVAIAAVNRSIAEGAHRAKPEAKVIVWSWAWSKPYRPSEMGWPDILPDAIGLLPQDVALMCTSEEALELKIGGVESGVFDYTMSQVAPSDYARDQWRQGLDHGLQAIAKVQLNNTWECSAVPYIPVPHLVQRHLDGLLDAGVSGLMLSWTVGGAPSPNLQLAARGYWDDSSGNLMGDEAVHEWARGLFGDALAAQVVPAFEQFCAAFPEFPFYIQTLYMAPQNFGPMNLLHAEPTGHRATMIGFVHDDLERWRSIYPADVFEEQWRKLAEGWRRGLEMLEHIDLPSDEAWRKNLDELLAVSRATYYHFRTSYLQTAFIRKRDRLRELGDSVGGEAERLLTAILEILQEETEVAKGLLRVARSDSRIGYEASNHYYYTRQNLREKVLNCQFLRELYELQMSPRL